MATILLEPPKSNEGVRNNSDDRVISGSRWSDLVWPFRLCTRERTPRRVDLQGDSTAEMPIKNTRPSTRLTREGYQFVFMLMFVWLAAILQNVNLLVLLAGAFCCMLLIQWRIASGTLLGLRAGRFVPFGVEARNHSLF